MFKSVPGPPTTHAYNISNYGPSLSPFGTPHMTPPAPHCCTCTCTHLLCLRLCFELQLALDVLHVEDELHGVEPLHGPVRVRDDGVVPFTREVVDEEEGGGRG